MKPTALLGLSLGIVGCLLPQGARAAGAADIGVQAVVKRPGCDLDLARIVVYNRNPREYYKVRVTATLRNDIDLGPQSCAFGPACQTSIDTVLTLSPCGTSNFCSAPTPTDGFPYCTSGSCLNTTTCNHFGQWCANFTQISVETTHVSSDGTNWTELKEQVCTKDDDSPFFDPACAQGSLCDNSIGDDSCSDFASSCQ